MITPFFFFFFKLIYLDLYWGRGWIDEQVP